MDRLQYNPIGFSFLSSFFVICIVNFSQECSSRSHMHDNYDARLLASVSTQVSSLLEFRVLTTIYIYVSHHQLHVVVVRLIQLLVSPKFNSRGR